MTTFDVEAFRQRERSEGFPAYYNGWLHLAASAAVMLGLCAWSLTQLQDVRAWEWGMLPLVALLGNGAVFFIHRDLLHRRRRGARFAYYMHSDVHHKFFTYEHIVCQRVRDLHAVLFPVWVVLLVLGGINLVGWFLLQQLVSANCAWFLMFGSSAYFLTYEVFHTASHLQDDHPLLIFPPFRYMRAHHRLHHAHSRMHSKNFNIIYPLGDILAGTFVREQDS